MSTVAQAVVRGLIVNGIDTVFALPGVQNDPLFDAFYEARERLRLIVTRHEQGAAYMALGAALATGRPAAFCVVPGPGILNTTGALCTAYACNAPVLALSGQIPSALIGRGLGVLHEIPDQLGMLRGLTKWAERIRAPEDAVSLVHEAFRQLASGRPRPVALECPMDMWLKTVDAAAGEILPAAAERSVLDEDAIRTAASLLARSDRPLIVVGSGAQGASAQITALAERLAAPVVAHRMGQGVLDGRHRLSANVVAGHRHWADADVVVAVGTRLQLQQMQWGLDEELAIIRIDVDPQEIERVRAPAVGILGDAAQAIDSLLGVLPNGRATSARELRIAEVRSETRRRLAHLEPQITLLQAIRAELPDDGIFVDELTQLGYVSRLSFPVHRPRSFLSPGYQGTLGWGVATALGAKVARPDAPVVVVSGDGGFMFNVQELATAVQYEIPIAIVLVNDGAYGNVRRTQIEDFGERVIGSELRNPDFCRLAESFGAHARRARTAEDLRAGLRSAFAARVPTVIEIRAGSMPNPWSFLRFERVRGVRSA